MPRSPYFSGPLSSGGVAHGPTPPSDFLENIGGLGGAIGDAVGRMFYDEERDPRAQQARLYAAQAGQLDRETSDAARASIARESLPDRMSVIGMDPHDEDGTPWSPDQRQTRDEGVIADAVEYLIGQGVEGEEANMIARTVAAGRGVDDSMGRYAFAGAGHSLDPDEAFTRGDRDNIRGDQQQQEWDINESDNLTREYGYDRGYQGDAYRADQSRAASQYGDDRDLEGTRYNADRDYDASALDTRYDYAADLAGVAADRRDDILDSEASRYATDEEQRTERGQPGGGGGDGDRPQRPREPVRQQEPQRLAPPQVGEVRNGYRFNGGDPADQSNWTRAA